MKPLNILTVIPIFLLLFFNTSHAQDTALINTAWENQLHSILRIQSIDPVTKQIRGTYESPSGTGGQAFPVIGFINSLPVQPNKDNVTAISFTVRWGTIGSITSWNGVYRASENIIVGQWLLSRPVTDYRWDHILTGQDIFTLKK